MSRRTPSDPLGMRSRITRRVRLSDFGGFMAATRIAYRAVNRAMYFCKMET